MNEHDRWLAELLAQAVRGADVLAETRVAATLSKSGADYPVHPNCRGVVASPVYKEDLSMPQPDPNPRLVKSVIKLMTVASSVLVSVVCLFLGSLAIAIAILAVRWWLTILRGVSL